MGATTQHQEQRRQQQQKIQLGKKRSHSQHQGFLFRNVIQPQLDYEQVVDMGSYLADWADWAPKRLDTIKKACHDITYEVLQAASRDISVSYTGLSLQALVEYRSKDNSIRFMLKVSTPHDSKVCQAGSYAVPVLRTSKFTQKAYLYMAILNILTMICDHKKADIALIKNSTQMRKPDGFPNGRGLRASLARVLKSSFNG